MTSTGSSSAPDVPTRTISSTGRLVEISRRAASSLVGIRARWISIHVRGQWPASRDQQGVPTESGNRLRDYLAYWLSEVAQHELRPRTFETYARAVDRHIVPVLGGKRLRSLTPADVRSLMNAKLAEGLAPRTVHYLRAVLRSALSQAVREGLVQRNVAALVRPPRAPRR